MRILPAYLIAMVIFLVLDMLWLGVVARGMYNARIGGMLLEKPNWTAAGIFYLLFVAGLVYFAIAQNVAAGDWRAAGVAGALYGFFCYATYNWTNLAVMKGYDPLVAVIDNCWGVVVAGVSAAATVAVLKAFGSSG